MSDKDPDAGVIKTLIICSCVTVVAVLALLGLAVAFDNGC